MIRQRYDTTGKIVLGKIVWGGDNIAYEIGGMVVCWWEVIVI